MVLEGIRIGFAVTGSFCTIAKIIPEVKHLVDEGARVYPILSKSASEFDTKFGKADEWKEQLTGITGNSLIDTIIDAEPIGPKSLFDIMIVAPCTGNTLSKLVNGITDTAVTMACKAHLRNQRPIVIAISTNDGLGTNAKNLGMLLNTKNIYFVPFGQDDPMKKCNSLVANFEQILPTVEAALNGKQVQPVLLKN